MRECDRCKKEVEVWWTNYEDEYPAGWPTDLEVICLECMKILGLNPRLFVNTYDVDRVYGGPEEGGWWYDEGILIESMPVLPEQLAEVLEREQKEVDKYNEGRPPISSVLSRGRRVVRWETHEGKDYPEKTPHYE